MLLELLSMSHTADDLRAHNTQIDRAATLGASVVRLMPARFSFLHRFNPFSRFSHPAEPVVVFAENASPANPAVDTAAAAITAACLAA